MKALIITSVIICSTSFLGSLVGFTVKKFPEKLNDLLTAFSAGIMLYAAITGLILPAIEVNAGFTNIILVCIGIICGALFIKLISKLIPYIEKFIFTDNERKTDKNRMDSLLLFVLAVAIHHFPEGIATGVSFGTGEISDIITVTSGISIQNFPEGMIIIPPMLSLGMNKKKIIITALFSSLIEAVGTFTGFFLVNISQLLLPLILASAGGTILFVIFENMVPEIKRNIKTDISTFVILSGFCFMTVIDSVI